MAMEAQQLSLFDYASLDTDTRLFVQEKAQSIHTRLKRTAEDIIAIGQDLIAVKERLEKDNNNKRGLFMNWLQHEFDMSQPTAWRFMQVARRFEKKLLFTVNNNFPVKVLYELASPSTPETVVEMVETGQIEPTLSAIREAKRELQQEQPSPFPLISEYVEPTRPTYTPPVYTPPTYTPSYTPPTYYTPPPVTPPYPVSEDIDEEETEELLDEIEEEYEDEPHTEEVPVQRRGVPAALQTSESNEWYTPAQYVEAARTLMGGIDLDPASNAYVNEKVIQATTYYDIETNGLDKDWFGRVWLNPPYGLTGGESNQELWSRRLIEQLQAGVTEAVLLVNANTEAKWFQPLYGYPLCLTNHRIRFYNISGESSQPTQGNAFIYFGPKHKLPDFISIFSQFGTIVLSTQFLQKLGDIQHVL